MIRSRLVAGPIFVVLGVLLLLDEAGRIDAWSVLEDWWPVALLLMAVALAAVPPRRPLAGGLLGLVGGAALLVSLDVVGSAAVLWPLALIGIGVVLVARPSPVPSAVRTAQGGIVALFDDQAVRVPAGPYDGQAYTALFGDLRLDLRDVVPGGDTRVELTSVFGDIEVDVPVDWEVTIDGPRIFGDVRVDPPAAVGGGGDVRASARVRLQVVAVFGDIRVRRDAVVAGVR